MRKISVYFLFAVVVLIGTAANELLIDYYNSIYFYRSHFSRKASLLSDEAYMAQAYLKADPNLDHLLTYLSARKKLEGIDFWALYYDGTVYRSNIGDKEWPNLRFQLKDDRSVVLDRAYAYASAPLDAKFQVVVGLRYNEQSFAYVAISQQIKPILTVICNAALIGLLLFIYFFRDVIQALRLFAQRRPSTAKLHTHSLETDRVARTLQSFAETNLKLSEELNKMSWQVLPSLRTELMSGRTPPYEFDCTLVRTDINNFSSIFNEHPVEEFMATINEFFTELSHVVARYNGLVHEFIGDEVIYYFKEQGDNTVALALSAARDINALASRLSQQTQATRGYAFTVKTSLASGRIRYGRFVNGYNLAGTVLIETVRVLSHVHEKDGNIIVFDARHAEKAQQVARIRPYATVELKGFKQAKELFVYQGHHLLRDRVFDGSDPSALGYYRSDADLAELIMIARNKAPDSPLLKTILPTLRRSRVTQSNMHPQIAWVQWCQSLLHSHAPVHLLASVVGLSWHLIAPSEISESAQVMLKSLAQHQDPRVAANAIEALSHFEVPASLPEQHSNRSVAQALIYDGQRSLNRAVIKRLKTMLLTNDPARTASALYALGEIVRYHRSRDPIALAGQTRLWELIEKLPRFVLRSEPSVRIQALRAAAKTQDERVLQSLRELAERYPDLSQDIEIEVFKTLRAA